MKRINKFFASLLTAVFLMTSVNVSIPALSKDDSTYNSVQVCYASTKKAPTKSKKQSNYTVYTTKTGKKYHRSGCRYLSKSCYKTTLSSAKSRGYSPCSVCRP